MFEMVTCTIEFDGFLKGPIYCVSKHYAISVELPTFEAKICVGVDAERLLWYKMRHSSFILGRFFRCQTFLWEIIHIDSIKLAIFAFIYGVFVLVGRKRLRHAKTAVKFECSQRRVVRLWGSPAVGK